MLLQIPDVLTADEVRQVRLILAEAEWVDGRATSGYQASEVKRNAQVKEGSQGALAAGDIVLKGIARAPQFMSAALPLRVFPPMFNSYAGGQMFGNHISTRPSARMWSRRSASAPIFPPRSFSRRPMNMRAGN